MGSRNYLANKKRLNLLGRGTIKIEKVIPASPLKECYNSLTMKLAPKNQSKHPIMKTAEQGGLGEQYSIFSPSNPSYWPFDIQHH